jgi:hypothetical protein
LFPPFRFSPVLSGPIGPHVRVSSVQAEAPNGPSFRKATRLLARLPQWRAVRLRLYLLGVWITPIPGFLFWRYLAGPEWWFQPMGIVALGIGYLLAYVCLWDWCSVKYKRAILVVLNASGEQSAGPMIDACCGLFVSSGPWKEVKRALIERLARVTSPDDDSLTDVQLRVLHDIVQGRHLPRGFDTASLCIILNALVHLGDTRTVTCLQERVGGAGKACENETVRATTQECLVRLQERLAAESLRASLLRSSEQISPSGATLLRSTTSKADATASEQLLRSHSEP